MGASSSSQSSAARRTSKPIPLTAKQRKAIESSIATLSLDAKLGQLFQIDWRGLRTCCLPCCATMLCEAMGLAERPLGEHDAAVRDAISDKAVGSVLGGGGAHPNPNTPHAWRAQFESLQRAAKGMPLLIANDSVHGQVNLHGAVLIPHHIGQGCMRDAAGKPDTHLVEQLAALAAKESYACGINWVFSPCVAVAHDLRWGRTYEAFSEDATLVGQLGAAEVRGLQSSGGVPVAACVKHWVADGGTALGSGGANFGWTGAPTHLLDQGDAQISERELRKAHVSAYLPSLAEGVLTVMVSYSKVQGEPVHASRQLVTDLLKEQLGFDGLVVSDFDAVPMLITSNGQVSRATPANDLVEAVAAALNAGIDMIMTPGGMYGGPTLAEQLAAARTTVERGLVPMSRVDDALRRILRVKHALGLLDDDKSTRVDALSPAAFDSCVGCAAHRTLSRRAAAQSAVLLINRDGLLPLLKRPCPPLYVTGRGASHLGMQCGGWSMEWQGIHDGTKRFTPGTTIWEGIRAACDSAILLPDTASAASALLQKETVRRERSEAPEEPPVAIVVTGERAYAEGGGDTLDLTLGSEDVALISSLAATGARVVLLLLSGRPLVIPPETLEHLAALVACWLPGTEGDGVADVVFGRRPFSGQLSFSWPRNNEQASLEGRRGKSPDARPLFAFGFGLRTVAAV